MGNKKNVDKKLFGWKPIHHVGGVPWPRIDSAPESGQDVDVPLKENYLMRSMDYLDTPEARKIFEVQADFIKRKNCKGIVDIGCRTGTVNDILHEWGYENYNYMGFDTSPEPIQYSQKVWEEFPNIEYRCASWNCLSDIRVNFDVDVVIWSGVLLYRPEDHLQFFDRISKEFYRARYALIQEPLRQQRHWLKNLKLNTIADELHLYKEKYLNSNETIVDAEIFNGRRVILELEL